MSARLEVRELTLELPSRRVVEALGFDLHAGEVVGLVGRSGSGKSMTARALIGLPPTGATVTGAVRLDGRELLGLAERELRGVRGRGIGLVFQEPATALDPVMPVRAQVAEGLRVHGMARGGGEAASQAQAWLERLSLDVPPSRRPHQLSGGQRQRAALAAALALRPAVLIADEPTTALDPITAAEIVQLLVSQARKAGSALLLVSHDLALVAAVADRLLVLDGGRIVAAGPTLEVLAGDAPATVALREAVRAAPRKNALVRTQGAVVLQASGLTRLYAGAAGRRAGVQAVSFSLHEGERLAVVGETGAGKSTLLRLLLGLETPQAGEVRLAGERFGRGAGRALRRHIQPVFQDPAGSFDPRWSAGRIVAEPLALLRLGREAARTRVIGALETVGLSAADALRPARSFSGGQRQRLALARALSVAPRVLVLDEATSALDPVSRAEIMALLTDLGERTGLACVVVTHDVALVRGFADTVMVLQAGRIVEEGPADRLLAAPRHAYTRALLAAAPDLDMVLARRLSAAAQA